MAINLAGRIVTSTTVIIFKFMRSFLIDAASAKSAFIKMYKFYKLENVYE